MTDNQHEILTLICDRQQHEGDCTDNPLIRYWCPTDKNDWSDTLKKFVWVDGAGFVSSLNAMTRKGWLKVQKAHKYARSITEEGRIQLEVYREKTGFYNKRGS